VILSYTNTKKKGKTNFGSLDLLLSPGTNVGRQQLRWAH